MSDRQNVILTKGQVYKMSCWQNVKLTKCQVDKMSSWQNVKLTDCQVEKKSIWWNVRCTKCLVDKMSSRQSVKLTKVSSWWNVRFTKCHADKRSSWWNVKLTKCQVDLMSGQNVILSISHIDLGRQNVILSKSQVDEMLSWQNVNWPSSLSIKYFITVTDPGEPPSGGAARDAAPLSPRFRRRLPGGVNEASRSVVVAQVEEAETRRRRWRRVVGGAQLCRRSLLVSML